MVFKRRHPRTWAQTGVEMVYPRGGWRRAFLYVKYRMGRLPDSPERIARGIWAGVFTSFSPLYGLHFLIAVVLARLMKGNILAALMATFFGNPLTYVPIGVVSLKTGHWLLGMENDDENHRSFGGKFVDAWRDLRDNFRSIFNDTSPDWDGLIVFYDEIFFPYLVGGVLPGVLCATVCYYLSAPLIHAYQTRRRGLIKAKFNAIKKKAAVEADVSRPAD